MLVIPQALDAHFKGEEAFDIFVGFLIANPQDKSTEAAYTFNKYGSGKKPKLEDSGFKGSLDFNTVENPPFDYDKFAGKLTHTVEALLYLDSSDTDRFTITLDQPKRPKFSLDLTFMGNPPEWLSSRRIWHGKLTMYEIKTFR